MASKKNSHVNEEPVGWVTVKGVHFPKWKDGTIGWDQGQANVNDKGTMSTEELNKAELRRDELWDKEDKHKITKAEKKELDDLQRSISEHYAAKRKYESEKVKEVSKEVKSSKGDNKKFSANSSAERINAISKHHNNGGSEGEDWKKVRAELDNAPTGTVMIQTGNRGAKFQYEKQADGNWKNTNTGYVQNSKTVSMSWVGFGVRPQVEFTTSKNALTNEQVKDTQDAAVSGRLNQALGLDRNGRKIGNRSTPKVDSSVPKTASRNAKYDTGRATLTSKSSSQLKTMYKNASPEEQKKIASEMAIRGFYRKDGKWYSRGGGR